MTNTFNRNDGTFAQVDYASVSGTPTQPSTNPVLTSVTNATTADISLNGSLTVFADGPSVSQGSSGIWYASGALTFNNTAGSAQCYAELWDGTSVIASGAATISAINQHAQIALTGVLTSPAGNLRMSGSSNSASTVLSFNQTGKSKDCNITALRIG